ncbi:MAG: chemotaxis protein CheW [Proteobacteria bacterium]|nr:chemotaxis protein CheW [Pseudomonadota bacterium]MBU1689004.1 chemotaxis protein CheW [Pseudomonadota bacterium]
MPEKPIAIDDCWNRIGVWSEAEERCPELNRMIHCRNCPVYADVGRQLLNRKALPEYIKESTAIFARAKAEKQEKIKSVFVFRAGGEWLALPSVLIQEVVDMGIIHSLPHRNSKVLRGVVNIRGKLELCFSIGAILGIERFEKSRRGEGKYVSPARLVVADRHGERVVFPVSEIHGYLRYGDKMLQPLPITVSGSRAAFTIGILCVEDFDVGLLNDQVLYEALKRNL